jgi:hypothetical protein
MQARIINLIMYFLAKLKVGKKISKLEVLRSAEFCHLRTEVSAYPSWIYDEMNVKQPLKRVTKPQVQSYRIFHQVENHILTSGPRGFLIEKAVITGSTSIRLSKGKSIAAPLLFDFNTSSNYGNGLMLNYSETFN